MKAHTIESDDSPAARDFDSADRRSWAAYCERMKGQATQEYLAGDLEGYRRGYGERKREKQMTQESTDLTLAGAIYIAVIAAAVGFLIGFNVAAM